MTLNIPDHVMIGGCEFNIEVAHIQSGEYGLMHFDDRKIVISTICLQKRSVLRATLRHEILHAALHMSGVSFSDNYEEEVIVRAVENIFFPAWDEFKMKLEQHEE
jgi:hypothetical protein